MASVVVAEILRTGGRDRRVGEAAARPRRRGLAVEQGRFARRPDPAFAADRLVDDTDQRPTVLQERDQRAEDRPAGHEADRAVDRIEHPLAGGPRARRAIFLADDAVARGFGVEQPAHRSEEHTSELQSLMRTSYAVFGLKQ